MNPAANTIVSLRPREVLMAEAQERDNRLARGETAGWMHGFPHPVICVARTAGNLCSPCHASQHHALGENRGRMLPNPQKGRGIGQDVRQLPTRPSTCLGKTTVLTAACHAVP